MHLNALIWTSEPLIPLEASLLVHLNKRYTSKISTNNKPRINILVINFIFYTKITNRQETMMMEPSPYNLDMEIKFNFLRLRRQVSD